MMIFFACDQQNYIWHLKELSEWSLLFNLYGVRVKTKSQSMANPTHHTQSPFRPWGMVLSRNATAAEHDGLGFWREVWAWYLFFLLFFCSDHLKRSLNSRHLETAFGYTHRGPLAYFFVTLVSALFSLEKGQGKSLSLELRRFLNCSNRPVKATVVFHMKLFTCSKVIGLNPHFFPFFFFFPFLTRFSDCVF